MIIEIIIKPNMNYLVINDNKSVDIIFGKLIINYLIIKKLV